MFWPFPLHHKKGEGGNGFIDPARPPMTGEEKGKKKGTVKKQKNNGSKPSSFQAGG